MPPRRAFRVILRSFSNVVQIPSGADLLAISLATGRAPAKEKRLVASLHLSAARLGGTPTARRSARRFCTPSTLVAHSGGSRRISARVAVCSGVADRVALELPRVTPLLWRGVLEFGAEVERRLDPFVAVEVAVAALLAGAVRERRHHVLQCVRLASGLARHLRSAGRAQAPGWLKALPGWESTPVRAAARLHEAGWFSGSSRTAINSRHSRCAIPDSLRRASASSRRPASRRRTTLSAGPESEAASSR